MRRRIVCAQFRFPFRLHRSAFIVCFLAFLFSLSICVSFGNAQEKLKPKLQEWQINGILAALDDGYSGVKQKAFDKLREFEAEDLKAFPKQSEEIGKRAIDVLKNSHEVSKVRSNAACALRTVSKPNNTTVQVLTNILKNSNEAYDVRSSTASALETVGKNSEMAVQVLANVVKNSKENLQVRSNAAFALRTIGKANNRAGQVLTEFLKNNKASETRKSETPVVRTVNKSNDTAVQDPTEFLKYLTCGISLSEAEAVYATDDTTIQVLANILNNNQEGFDVRSSAADVLGTVGKANNRAVQILTEFLKNSNKASSVRGNVASALGNSRPLTLSEILIFIERTHDRSSDDFNEMRFASYFYGRGDSDIKTLLKWIGLPKRESVPTQLKYDEAKKTLEVFKKVWEPSREFPESRAELAGAIAEIAKMVKWQTSDIPLLEQHYKNLSDAKSKSADSVKAALDSLTIWKYFNQFRNIAAAHLAFWLALIFAYPKSPQVQAIFFWNPWVRKIGGAGYVGFLLAWVPFLRRKLFEPFRDSLLADAKLHSFNPDAYFPDSEVTLKGTDQPQPIQTVFPEIKGQSILEGDSGLGKTLFLRHLVKASQRIVVYLPAEKCEKGVIEAIQAKLHGQAQDADFLRNLIYSGAIDICIDGLNEVSADTRATISDFVERYFKGNILITTQPIEWSPPSTAKTYVLQPLRPDQIQTFLISRQTVMPVCATYAQDCDRYLQSALSPNQSPEERTAAQRILSNPMDLSIVAQMLAQGRTPDLFRLQEQQYTLMANEYRQIYSSEFPLKPFCEAVYQRRLNDEPALPADEFYNELICMEDDKHKMVISRQWKDTKGEIQKEWYFRHDKIAEFFIVQTFLGDSETAQTRMYEHLGDPRFRGVYFLLATFLSIDAAQDLRETLIQYAADTKDHTVSDTFVQLLRTRKA